MPEQARTHSGRKDQKRGGGYRYGREPLRGEEADLLSNACRTAQDELIVWTLLDTGLRVSELCGMTAESIQWQQRRIRVQEKGGPYGKKTKGRTVPMSLRVRALLEPWFALNDHFSVGPRRVQKIVKEIANGRRSAGRYPACHTAHLCHPGPAEGHQPGIGEKNSRARPAVNERNLPEPVSFFAQVEAETGVGLPDFIKAKFDAFLECGILAHGFLRVRCTECAHEKLVAFSCKNN